MLGIVALNCVATPWLALFIVPSILVMLYIRYYTARTLWEWRRIEATSEFFGLRFNTSFGVCPLETNSLGVL